MATTEIVVDIRFKWWVRPSVAFLLGLYRATGWHPDCEKVAEFYTDYGMKVSSARGKIL